MQGVLGRQHMPARQVEERVHGVWGREHMPARQDEENVQGVRGRQRMRARQAEEQVQGVRGRKHMRARQAEEQVRGVRGEPLLYLVIWVAKRSGRGSVALRAMAIKSPTSALMEAQYEGSQTGHGDRLRRP